MTTIKLYSKKNKILKNQVYLSGGALDFATALKYGKKAYDVGQKGYELAKKYGPIAKEIYESKLAKQALSFIPSSDENAREGYEGESNTMLRLKNGKMGIANYCGPNTNIIERLKRGDPPRNLVDMVCMLHDIQYALASSAKDKNQQHQLIYDADITMLMNLNIVAPYADKYNVNLVRAIIGAKAGGQVIGKLDKNKFSGSLNKYSSDQIQMLKSFEQLLINTFNSIKQSGISGGSRISGGGGGSSKNTQEDTPRVKLLKEVFVNNAINHFLKFSFNKTQERKFIKYALDRAERDQLFIYTYHLGHKPTFKREIALYYDDWVKN